MPWTPSGPSAPEGAGNEAAAVAWQQAAQVDVSRAPQLLAGLKGANPLAANWIRTAVDTVCERTPSATAARSQNRAFEQFVLKADQAPKARRLAYEWLLKVDPAAEGRIVPQLLDDPSVELRRDAVARLIEQGEKAVAAKQKDEAAKLLQKAFDAARDRDQIGAIVKLLKDLGGEVDLVTHDGLIVDWQVIGPFDNADEAGFDKVYPPETAFDASAEYQGKHGNVAWLDYRSEDPAGKVDLYKALEETLTRISEKLQERDVVAYAVSDFHSPSEKTVQIRSSTMNAIKIWVNGVLVDEHNVYHAGSQFDQYQADAVIRRGSNRIMVKLCQNAQTQSWTETFRVSTSCLRRNRQWDHLGGIDPLPGLPFRSPSWHIGSLHRE